MTPAGLRSALGTVPLAGSASPLSPKPLALSLGDPAGVGPEIVVKAWHALRRTGPAFLVVGDHDALAAASPAGSSLLQLIGAPEHAAEIFPDRLPVLDIPLQAPVVAGKPSPAYAAAVIR